PSGPEPARGASTALGLKGDSAVDKTNFSGEVGPAQELNIHVDLARNFEAQGNFDAAVAEYQKAIDAVDRPGPHRGGRKATARHQALAHRRMAGALDRLGRFAQAETHYRTALKLHGDDPKVWNDAGYSYYLQGRYADAERSLKTAAKLDPNDPKIQTN